MRNARPIAKLPPAKVYAKLTTKTFENFKFAFARRLMRRSRKHTDIGILGVKSHSYRTIVKASACAIRETSSRLVYLSSMPSRDGKLLSVGGNNSDINKNVTVTQKVWFKWDER